MEDVQKKISEAINRLAVNIGDTVVVMSDRGAYRLASVDEQGQSDEVRAIERHLAELKTIDATHVAAEQKAEQLRALLADPNTDVELEIAVSVRAVARHGLTGGKVAMAFEEVSALATEEFSKEAVEIIGRYTTKLRDRMLQKSALLSSIADPAEIEAPKSFG